ncbi:spore coat protein, CotS family [Clostridium cavendishii DSM 21758]|uniref:Spore coat protein, CotS family n=1 Tax=Clostridium cavendishii DSM 21758 TaxID=1121302 RepID=A0A1M6U7H9_9CLOT|nr:CotS family spore coat protein [Clostridium cavendishii]SHK65123.1 spore coat protein, CotS family [Clostridium cavendishii DSM 21758]
MDIDALRKFIEENYGLEILDLKKIKNVYKIGTLEKDYCLKVIKYDYKHFNFILSAILHLQKNEFKTTPEIIKTKNNRNYISFDYKYAYLTPWIISRESNYDNIVELTNVAIKLSELHKCSEGFNLRYDMKPRIYWFTWLKTFETRGYEILDFKKRISQKANKSDFDKLYLSLMDKEIFRVNESIEMLKEANYIKVMEKEVFKRGFCHHDYAHHNVLIDQSNNISLIDFDYCILDTRLHDLASLVIRSMKDDKWDVEKFKMIIEAYSINSHITDEDIDIMIGFMKFPQAYWQLGIQYYWEQQNYGEEFFIKKLLKYKTDIAPREEFLKYLKINDFGGSI